MKRFTLLLTLFLLLLCSCRESEQRVDRITTAATTIVEDTEYDEDTDADAIKLLNYYFDDGEYRFNTKDWEKLRNWDLFREHFFAKWDNQADGEQETGVFIDDSEKSFFNVFPLRDEYFYAVNDHVYAFMSVNGDDGTGNIYWLDVNNPDKLFKTAYVEYDMIGTVFTLPDIGKENAVIFFRKTDESVNNPENGYLSVFRLLEMADKYGFNYSSFLDLSYSPKDNNIYLDLVHNSTTNNYPIYLVRETEKAFEFRTYVGDRRNPQNSVTEVYFKYIHKGLEGWKTSALEYFELTDESEKEIIDLLNCGREASGRYLFNTNDYEEIHDYDTIRKFFYGTWRGDSDYYFKTNNFDMLFVGAYKTSENGLAYLRRNIDGNNLFWLDINKPDVIYGVSFVYESGEDIIVMPFGHNYYDDFPEAQKIHILYKTDEEIYDPADGTLGVQDIHSLEYKYGIPFHDLVVIDYNEEMGYEPPDERCLYLWHDAWYNFNPMYLISESSDKVEIKTSVSGDDGETEKTLTAYMTFEKSNGEWTRTVTFEE